MVSLWPLRELDEGIELAFLYSFSPWGYHLWLPACAFATARQRHSTISTRPTTSVVAAYVKAPVVTWLQPSSTAIRRTPQPSAFSRTIAATSLPNPPPKAGAIARLTKGYLSVRWHRDKYRMACPPGISGKPEGVLWRMLKTGARPLLSARADHVRQRSVNSVGV